jgi:asparagine synthase (glutamine-hydrolysing)
MLASISEWGWSEPLSVLIDVCLALWDRQERTLHLGRDRLGEKPSNYGWMGQTFYLF